MTTSPVDKLRFALPLVTHGATYFARIDMQSGGYLPTDEQTPVISLEDLEKLLDRLDTTDKETK